MREQDPNAVAFVLPDGLSLGGVTTWSLQMKKLLQERERPAYILRHRFAREVDEYVAAEAGSSTIECSSRHLASDFESNVAKYRSILPAVIVPNWSPEAYSFCAKLSRRDSARLRVIGYCHTDEEQYYATLCRYEPIIHRFVAVSQVCAERLRGLLPHRAQDIVERAYGVEVPSRGRRPPLPADAPLRLLYAGRIVEKQKRVFDLVVLAEELMRRGVHFTMRIVGDGVDRSALIARWQRLPAAARERVSIEPAVSPGAMSELYHQSDVCVLTSAYEGTSIFMLEAMAHGCVPVVTQVSGVAEVLTAGETGLAFPIGAMDEMAAGIARLASQRDWLQQAGARAHECSRQWSNESYADWFETLIASAWNDHDRAWPIWRSSRRNGWRSRIASIPGVRPIWRMIHSRLRQ